MNGLVRFADQISSLRTKGQLSPEKMRNLLTTREGEDTIDDLSDFYKMLQNDRPSTEETLLLKLQHIAASKADLDACGYLVAADTLLYPVYAYIEGDLRNILEPRLFDRSKKSVDISHDYPVAASCHCRFLNLRLRPPAAYENLHPRPRNC